MIEKMKLCNDISNETGSSKLAKCDTNGRIQLRIK